MTSIPRFVLAAASAALLPFGAQAASFSLLPESTDVAPGSTVVLALMMDVDSGTPLLGGGLDLALGGGLSFVGFSTSAWFDATMDPAFSGHGAARADQAYEVHFGSFSGFSGQERLGSFTVNVADSGSAALDINSFWGGFFDLAGLPVTPAFEGAVITASVPEPPMLALWALAGGLFAFRARQRLSRGKPC